VSTLIFKSKRDFVDFLVNILTLLTFGQSFDFVDLFSKKNKSEEISWGKIRV
jgi:hypothetical protein